MGTKFEWPTVTPEIAALSREVNWMVRAMTWKDCAERLEIALLRKEGFEHYSRTWRAINGRFMHLERYLHYTAEYLKSRPPEKDVREKEDELAAIKRRVSMLGCELTSFAITLPYGLGGDLVKAMRDCVCAAVGVPVYCKDVAGAGTTGTTETTGTEESGEE